MDLLMIKYRKRSDGLYVCTETYRYFSRRYDERITIYEGTVRDGASGAIDIESSSWWVHDEICARTPPKWDSGALISAWQAATVLSDILAAEGRWARAFYWRWSTFLFGCKAARKNGLVKAD